MVALTDELRKEYVELYTSAKINPSKAGTMTWYANKIQKNQAKYIAVATATKVPWYLIAAIHHLESSGDFSTHLHNGDPLSAKTYHVPAGRPKTHEAPFTWEESAIDALGYDGATGIKVWDLATTLWFAEMYNGSGYRVGAGQKTTPPKRSPYLWSFTQHYIKGRYVKDGVFDVEAVSGQAGVVAIFKALEERGLIPAFATPPVVVKTDVWGKLHEILDPIIALQTT